MLPTPVFLGFPGGSVGKESTWGRPGFDPWVGKIPWTGKWQPTPVFLPGKSHGQRSLAGLQSIGSQRVGHNWGTEHTGSFGNAWGHFSVTTVGGRFATNILWVGLERCLASHSAQDNSSQRLIFSQVSTGSILRSPGIITNLGWKLKGVLWWPGSKSGYWRHHFRHQVWSKYSDYGIAVFISAKCSLDRMFS